MSQEPSEPSTSATQGEYLIRIYTTLREGSRVVGSRLAERRHLSSTLNPASPVHYLSAVYTLNV